MLTWALASSIMFTMNSLDIKRKAAILSLLCEGNSIASTCRITGAAKNTVIKLLLEVGEACDQYQDRVLRNLNCPRVQCDEIWSFVGSKEKNTTKATKKQGMGDAWTWTAIDADSKLIVSWLVGGRDAGYAHDFMHDVAARLAPVYSSPLTATSLTSRLLLQRSATTSISRNSSSITVNPQTALIAVATAPQNAAALRSAR